MSGADTAILRDLAPLNRPARSPLRRGLAPGPLRPLARRQARPGFALWGGVVGLSFAVSLLVAPHLRGSDPVPPPPAPIAEEPRESTEPVRVVGLPPPTAAAPADNAAPTEAPSVPSASIAPAEPVAEPVRPATAPAADLGPLPVLEMDASAFDPMPTPALEEAPRSIPQAARRP